jgi:hypothetical protein
MTTRRLAWFLLLPAVLLLAFGCTKRPDEPEFDNPFDPAGPDAGNPFHLEARESGNNVLVSWDQPPHPDITSYNVLRSADGQSFALRDTVPPMANSPTNQYIDTTPLRNAPNYYKVQAVNSVGQTTASSRVAAVPVVALPYLEIAGGAASTATRLVDVSFGSRVGDTAELDSLPDFPAPLITAVVPGDTVLSVPWDLGPAGSDEEYKHVYLRIMTGGVSSEVARDSIQVQFRPSFSVAGNPPTVAGRDVQLAVASTGVSLMRFASSSAGLASASWVPGAPTVAYRLEDRLGQQIIYGEFQGDFGLPSSTATTTAAPDELEDAGFVIAGDAELTDSAAVELHCDAVALWMRFSEAPDLAGVPWVPYADTLTFNLSPAGGLKVVYGQFRNDWVDSPVLSDWITLVAQDLDVQIVTPFAGATLEGGTPLLMTGIAVPASGGDPVDLVEVDTGEGWITTQGIASWSHLWDVPSVLADSTATLRARATAGELIATDTVTVTIVPAAGP